MSHKKWRRGGVRERGRKNLFSSSYSLASHAGAFRGTRFSSGAGWKTSSPKNACVGGYLLSPSYALPSSSTFVFLRSPFRATAHYPLSTVHYACKRLVHSEPESFFQCRCKGSIDVSLGAFDILKAHIVKRHFFFHCFLLCCRGKFLVICFLWWCFIVDRNELKYFLKGSLQSTFISVIVIHRNVHVYLLLVFNVTPFKIDQNKNQNRSNYKARNLGNERRYVQIYRDLYGDAVLVPTWMGTNMADGNQQKHLSPVLVQKRELARKKKVF